MYNLWWKVLKSKLPCRWPQLKSPSREFLDDRPTDPLTAFSLPPKSLVVVFSFATGWPDRNLLFVSRHTDRWRRKKMMIMMPATCLNANINSVRLLLRQKSINEGFWRKKSMAPPRQGVRSRRGKALNRYNVIDSKMLSDLSVSQVTANTSSVSLSVCPSANRCW